MNRETLAHIGFALMTIAYVGTSVVAMSLYAEKDAAVKERDDAKRMLDDVLDAHDYEQTQHEHSPALDKLLTYTANNGRRWTFDPDPQLMRSAVIAGLLGGHYESLYLVALDGNGDGRITIDEAAPRARETFRAVLRKWLDDNEREIAQEAK